MRYKDRIFRLIWEIVFPENIYCIACGNPVKKGEVYSLCETCRERLIYSQPENCTRCGHFVKRREVNFCEHCGSRPPKYDRGAAAVVYNDGARKIVHDLKYAGKGYLAKNAAQIMKGSIENLGEHDIMIPVPMFEGKKKTRGFCQTTLISEALSELTGIPVIKGNLVRVKNTVPMSGLEPWERRDNVKDAFSVKDRNGILNKKVLLVDDLLTTGSTAEECADVLKSAGAARVSLAVFASPYRSRYN